MYICINKLEKNFINNGKKYVIFRTQKTVNNCRINAFES